MIRQLSAIAVSMLVSVTPVIAQDAAPSSELLVQAASADVHKYPSVGSPVVGKATRGTALAIKRNLGSWVEVMWTKGESGTAFLHVNSGTISRHTTQSSGSAQAAIAQIAAVAAAATPATGTSSDTHMNGARMPASATSASARASYVLLPSHRLGVGALSDTSKPAFGATTRMWMGNSIGFQFNLARPQLESLDGRRMTSTQFAPSAIVAMPDALTNAMWLRPYVGGGPRVYRANLQNQIGYEAFGGAEATLAGLPQLALSADIAYRWRRPSFDGFEPNRIGFSIAAHWYVR